MDSVLQQVKRTLIFWGLLICFCFSGEILERFCNLGVVYDVRSKIVCKTKEWSNLFCTRWCSVFFKNLGLCSTRFNTFVCYYISRYNVFFIKNLDFVKWSFNLASWRPLRTSSNVLKWSSILTLALSRSSIYTETPKSPIHLKTSDMRRWYVLGALHSPKGMQRK